MKHSFNSRQRFSIRKFSFGAASVLLGTVLLGQNPVGAQEQTQGQRPNIQNERSVGSSRSSALNGEYSYGINPLPIPDDEYGNFWEMFNKHWNHAMYNWLSENAARPTFKYYTDSIGDPKVGRRTPRDNRKPTRLYRDEARTDTINFDVFQRHKNAESVQLNIIPRGDGSANLSVYDSSNRQIAEIRIPAKDLWIRQSDYDTQQAEREKNERQLRPKKTAAKQAVQDAADAKKRDIAANNQLTDTEKQAANDLVDNEVTEANRKIDEAGSDQALEQAKTEGLTGIDNVNPTPTAKPAAKQAAKQAADAGDNNSAGDNNGVGSGDNNGVGSGDNNGAGAGDNNGVGSGDNNGAGAGDNNGAGSGDNNGGADTPAVSNSVKDSAKKAGAKELPNTGTEQSSASLTLALLAAATGGLLFAKKREEEE
ncbi:neuraminidase A [Streptococcus pseudopneumoniae]|uniref:YSIRK signal domain/LPXTG anchor domain surface protein n=1 Tax=Streptococcus pseudopneumoniae TaxID=257758 RepID=UPI0005DC2B17|nr:YSIRK signal domain/LPXTG anchor domain surface protein [Streptococcus pseudopneumoniae]CJZ12365.1 neuraminidase A [Streptococcus pseudopneumoniae]